MISGAGSPSRQNPLKGALGPVVRDFCQRLSFAPKPGARIWVHSFLSEVLSEVLSGTLSDMRVFLSGACTLVGRPLANQLAGWPAVTPSAPFTPPQTLLWTGPKSDAKPSRRQARPGQARPGQDKPGQVQPGPARSSLSAPRQSQRSQARLTKISTYRLSETAPQKSSSSRDMFK